MTDFTARQDFAISNMTTLHATLHAAMYSPEGMPDAAMDALHDAHAACLAEIVKTPSASQDDVQAKTSTLTILLRSNQEAGIWIGDINNICQSIAADNARLAESQSFLMAAE